MTLPAPCHPTATMTDDALRQIDDLRTLFIDDVPLLDVRAPVEFAEGAFPTAENQPLIDDAERHAIGIAYKDRGQDAAIALGNHLVRGEDRERRIANWSNFMRRHPDGVLYCFRGGMRSQISQRWLYEHAGIACPRVRGGYKAMRRFLLDELERNSAVARPVVVGGRTGVGKTRLLARYTSAIDLERLAHHRGSAFGHHPQPQPSQISFENALSIALLKRVAAANGPFLVEDESRNIGGRHVPPAFYDAMQRAPVVLIEASENERIEITLQEYVTDALAEFVAEYGTTRGFDEWAAYLNSSLDRIRRRLGGDRHAEVKDMLARALHRHAQSGEIDSHRAWIDYLLREYYDGMYNYQLDSKQNRVVFRGPAAQIVRYLEEHHGLTPQIPT